MRVVLEIVGFVLLSLMVIYPSALELLYVKAILFMILLASVISVALFSTKLNLHYEIFLIGIFFSCLSLFFAVYGIENFAIGAKKQAQVYVLWPLVYMIIISGFRLTTLISLNRVVLYCSLFCGFLGVGFVLSQVGLIPEFAVFELFDNGKQGFSLEGGVMESRVAYMSSAPYLLPFCFALYFMKLKEPANYSRLLITICTFFLFLAVIVSGRRALYLIAFITPLLFYIFIQFAPKDNEVRSTRGVSTFLLALAALALLVTWFLSYLELDPVAIFDMFATGFDFSTDRSASARKTTFLSLIEGWNDVPILGAGHGSHVSYIRSSVMPWSYELFYVAILFQTGLVGFSFFALGTVWVFYRALQIIAEGGVMSQIMLPNILGFTGILIANATNPYFVRFDGLWAFFLQVGIINIWLISRRQSSASS